MGKNTETIHRGLKKKFDFSWVKPNGGKHFKLIFKLSVIHYKKISLEYKIHISGEQDMTGKQSQRLQNKKTKFTIDESKFCTEDDELRQKNYLRGW